jgi:hypothetical protein
MTGFPCLPAVSSDVCELAPYPIARTTLNLPWGPDRMSFTNGLMTLNMFGADGARAETVDVMKYGLHEVKIKAASGVGPISTFYVSTCCAPLTRFLGAHWHVAAACGLVPLAAAATPGGYCMWSSPPAAHGAAIIANASGSTVPMVWLPASVQFPRSTTPDVATRYCECRHIAGNVVTK